MIWLAAILIIVLCIGLEIFKENNKWDAPNKDQAMHLLKCLAWPITAIIAVYEKRKNKDAGL